MTRFAKQLAGHTLGVILGAWLSAAAFAQQPATPTAPAAAAAQAAPTPPVAPAAEAPKSEPLPAAGSTAVPGWNKPPAWAEVDHQPQYASLPGRETNVLVQESGKKWRQMHNGPVTFYTGWLILGACILLVIFYFAKGAIKLHEKPTGRVVERFNSSERVAHWTTAISFVVLAISGLVILFGKYVLLPVIGYSAFSWVTVILKNLHNFVGPLFIFSIVIFFVMYLKDNFLSGKDFEWLAKFGGMLSEKEVPSGRFNGGEKAWFWLGIVLFGVIMSVSGSFMLFPNWDTTREWMTIANLIHAIASGLFVSAALAHIYIGTIGTEGALQGMKLGYVDEAWARQHHELWYDEVKAGKRTEKVLGSAPQPAAGDD